MVSATASELRADDELQERKIFVGFEKHKQFLALQDELLTLDCPSEKLQDAQYVLLQKLSSVFAEYQEQSYLWDPFLERLVSPVVSKFKSRIQNNTLTPDGASGGYGSRTSGLSNLLYLYVKFRGYKTISTFTMSWSLSLESQHIESARFFPHEVADLTIVLDYFTNNEALSQSQYYWHLRYVMLLWLSLICMLPFDLSQFDEDDQVGQTAEKIEAIAKANLGRAGVERDAAAILLSRLYTRKDMIPKFSSFLQWCLSVVRKPNGPFTTIGCLRTLCEVAKVGPAEQVQMHASGVLEITKEVDTNENLLLNTLVRKLRSKLLSRTILRLLPVNVSRARRRGRALVSDGAVKNSNHDTEGDFDVPEETEEALESLFQSLQDKDTVVRYSSSKGIARIAERLPPDFTAQILENTMQLFSIHLVAVESFYEMPSIAEATWHGACLACAELARRGLVPNNQLNELINWLTKGAHSIGASVRDAASYVLWSLARAQDLEALSPHAHVLSQKLVTVALFDREVHIRRAASAGFQEYVGRTSLFPHGIDVLRKTDFYAIGTRRHAFLVAAKEVAEHEEYRPALIDHLLSVTLRHWDPTMRKLGAQSLASISQLKPTELLHDSAEKASQYLTFPDVGDVHGALLALTELADSCRLSGLEVERRKIFSYLDQVPSSIVQSPRHELITAAACTLIAKAISLPDIQLHATSAPWRKIVDFGLRSRSTSVQEATAGAMMAVSKLVDCSPVVQRFLDDFRLLRENVAGSPAMQQSVSRVLGVLDYNAHPHGLPEAIRYLLSCVNPQGPARFSDVEARKNAYTSMSLIMHNIIPRLSENISPEVVCEMIDALQAGLEDYSTDQRGDVGSWIRIACIRGLAEISELLIQNASNVPNFASYFPPQKYHDALGGILKQGVERLDNVRQQAGQELLRLLRLPLPDATNATAWQVRGSDLLTELFLSDSEIVGWNEGSWLFPRAVKILEIEEYRAQLLAGLVLSVSSKTDSTQRPVSTSLVDYARSLPLSRNGESGYGLRKLTEDLLSRTNGRLSSNNVVVPVLQTFNVLLEADALEGLYEDETGLQSLRSLLAIASRNVERLKNVQRILMSMRVVINLLPAAALSKECQSHLSQFLGHQYPKIRADTAEYLYLVLQTKELDCETDMAENIILETEWSSADIAMVRDAAQRCIASLVDEIN